jgi:hypothetical protein
MARVLKDGILAGICKYCENTEIPSIFALWAGISTVSAAMGRDCFIDQGHFTVYPNLYIVLVAGSAKCRKSTSINTATRFLEKMKPPVKLISQKMTTEALIGSLAGTAVANETTVINQAEGIAVVDELATLIDANAFKTGMIPLLTKLFDCEDFPYETRSRGIEYVRNPCMSILGGSTLHWIKESVPVVAIGGGFTSRVIFVYRDSFEKLIAWPTKNEDMLNMQEAVVHDLNEVTKLRGNFGFTDDAIKLYSTEYETFIKTSVLFTNKNLAGYAGRRHVLLLKLCMVVAASDKDTKLVNEQDVQVAIKILTNAETNMPKVLSAISSEVAGDLFEEVFNIIKGQKIITRSMLLRKLSNKLTARDLTVITETLVETQLISVQIDGEQVKYVFVGE